MSACHRRCGTPRVGKRSVTLGKHRVTIPEPGRGSDDPEIRQTGHGLVPDKTALSARYHWYWEEVPGAKIQQSSSGYQLRDRGSPKATCGLTFAFESKIQLSRDRTYKAQTITWEKCIHHIGGFTLIC